jgi:hypothetical protein
MVVCGIEFIVGLDHCGVLYVHQTELSSFCIILGVGADQNIEIGRQSLIVSYAE